MMTDAGTYRKEAQRCRDLAAAATDSEIARRWHRLADEYAILAEQLDASDTGRTPLLRMPLKPHPAQQQQRRATGPRDLE
jgi:hypothetical protein